MENVVTTEIKSIEQMPGFTNISGFSSFIGYLETDTGKTLLSRWEKVTIYKKRQKLLFAGGAAILVFVILNFYGGNFLYKIMLSLVTISIASAVTYLIADREKKSREDYFKDRRNYGQKIANFISSLLNSNYHYFPTGELFLYSNNFCSLIWIDNGNMVTYKNEHIKDINLHQIVTDKKSEIKWQLNIFSNLPEYPKITLRFDDDEQDIAQQLKKNLKPREEF